MCENSFLPSKAMNTFELTLHYDSSDWNFMVRDTQRRSDHPHPASNDHHNFSHPPLNNFCSSQLK